MKRKYVPIEKYPVYNKAYTRYQTESAVLNGGRNIVPSAYTTLWDKRNIESELRTIVGDKDGFYRDENTQLIAHIPYVEMQLAEIDQKFEVYKKLRVNSGYPKPKEMPTLLQNEFYELEARLDVLTGEKEFLETQLKKLADKVEKTDDSKVLEHGLTCSFHFHGTGAKNKDLVNVMKEIDGQMVSQLKSGMLYIDDERSPYDGMSIPDYRKLAKIWVADRIKTDAEKLKKLQDEAKAEGKPIPRSLGIAIRKVSRASLPSFPKWATNHKKERNESPPKRRRKFTE